AFSVEKGKGYHLSFSGEFMAIIREVLSDPLIRKVGYNVKSDLILLKGLEVEFRGQTEDIMIADYLLNPGRGNYALDTIAMNRLGYNLAGSTVDDDSGIKACEEADVALRVHLGMSGEISKAGLKELYYDVEMPLVYVLASMEIEGVGIDKEYLARTSQELGARIEKMSSKIYDIAGGEFNINSPKQLQTVLFDKLDLPVIKKTKTGASTDESVLVRLAEMHELPREILKYREISKLKATYYDSMHSLIDERTGRLHTSFNQTGTVTGRLSSSGPNLQNIPIRTDLGRGIRKAFIPAEKGDVVFSADYSQVELRILAHLSKDKKLLEAFSEGEDVHSFTASEIFNVPRDKVTGKMRSTAKTVNFGIVYGISAYGLSKDLGIGIQEAQSFIDAYFKRYEGVRTFIEDTITSARDKGYVATILNRRRPIPDINSGNEKLRGFAERTAVNTPVQGSAADVIKIAMIGCWKEFRDTDIKMILQVHDELVFEMPADKVDKAAIRIREIMEGALPLSVPLKVDMEYGSNWLDMEEVKA
ncbi:MAG: DNA polymerase I, partial [Candidatus Omnitrophica bacterium]|nr:DNA polymerase I [Candidatus Omnitrophota bacterium]